MKKLAVFCILPCVVILLCLAIRSFAETRGTPYTQEQLHKMSTLAFDGVVLEVETTPDKFKKTFPVKAQVLSVLKGKLEKKTLSFPHKSPGKCVIFEKEYNIPKVGEKGTFYLQEQGNTLELKQSNTLVLIGYIKKVGLKGINPIDESNVPNTKSALKTFIQKEDWLNNTQRVVAHGYFSIGFGVKGFASKGDRIWQIHLVGLDQTVERIFWLNAESKTIHELLPKKQRKTEQENPPDKK